MIDHDEAIFRPSYADRFLFHTRNGETVSLSNHFQNQPVFLSMGGPSLREINKEQIKNSNTLIFGVNNSWNTIRPDIWCCVDPPSTFTPEGWRDPKILKFAPIWHRKVRLREKKGDGSFRTLADTPGKSPNTLFFTPESRFHAGAFIQSPRVQIGAENDRRCFSGGKAARSVFFAALKLSIHLGFKRIYLIGADMKMKDSDCYACGETHNKDIIEHNNRTYAVINDRMNDLLPYMEHSGINIYNCTLGSSLTSVPSMDLQRAIDREEIRSVESADATEYYKQHDVKMETIDAAYDTE